MRCLLPLLLLVGLAACTSYQPDDAYQIQYQPGYAYTYDSGTYVQKSSGGFGGCEQAPFVWKVCPEPPTE